MSLGFGAVAFGATARTAVVSWLKASNESNESGFFFKHPEHHERAQEYEPPVAGHDRPLPGHAALTYELLAIMRFLFAIAADNLAKFLFPSRSLAWDYRCVAAITVRHVLPSTNASL